MATNALTHATVVAHASVGYVGNAEKFLEASKKGSVIPFWSHRPLKCCAQSPSLVDNAEKFLFLEASKKGNVIPLSRCIFSDHLTPVLAVKEGEIAAPSFLFESVESGHISSIGRYSVVAAAQPCMEILVKENVVTIMDHEEGRRSEEIAEDPLVIPRRIMEKWTPQVIDELPPVFCGGWVGYCSYDTMHYVEKKKLPFSNAPVDDRNLPDVHLGLYDSVIVFDHFEKKAYAIHWVQVDRYSSAEEAFNDGRNRLETLESRVHDIITPRLPAGSRKSYTRLFGPKLEMSNLQARGSILVASSPEILIQVSKPGSVEVEKLMNIERYSHVMHISSTSCPHNARTRKFIARASASAEAEADSSDHDEPFAIPLQLESPVGKILEEVLKTQPQLLQAAIDKQLQNLPARDDHPFYKFYRTIVEEHKKREALGLPIDHRHEVELYMRMTEEEKHLIPLEEIIYCSIVQKFLENKISMITDTSSDHSWPNQELKFEAVHSPQAFKMIQRHLSLVLGDGAVSPIRFSKFNLGEFYADSIWFGYFLKRVEERFQLEGLMGTLPKDFLPKDFGEEKFFDEPIPLPGTNLWKPGSFITVQDYYEDDNTDEGKLIAYLMQLDAKMVGSLTNLRSKEAVRLVDKQAQALFGMPLDATNELLSVSFSDLKKLALEAVTFGSFLLEKETYIDLQHPFIYGFKLD